MRIKFFRSTSYDPFYNLALEEYLFNKKKAGEIYIYLWKNNKTVVIGRYQNVYDEVDLQYAQENGIKIVRRITGGGAVYHDLGNLNYSFITDSDSGDIDKCLALLRYILSEYGIECASQGRNDITVNGYKVSGTARHIAKGKLLYHGTLLLNSDLNILDKVLTRKMKIADSKAKRSISRKVANLSDLARQNITAKDIVQRFIRQIGEAEEIAKDNETVQQLARSKYETTDWNYGFQPYYNYRETRRFQGGTLSITAHIDKGIIKSIQFNGDFFALKSIKELETKIKGAVVNELVARLQEIDAGSYIQGISIEDIANSFSDVILPLSAKGYEVIHDPDAIYLFIGMDGDKRIYVAIGKAKDGTIITTEFYEKGNDKELIKSRPADRIEEELYRS